MTAAATFTVVFIALYVGHRVGDHWVQTSAQSAAKGGAGRSGRAACTRHILTLTGTKLVVLVPVAVLLDVRLTAAGTLAGLTADAASHWWADRRSTLARLARRVGQEEFYALGTGAHPKHPVTADGTPAAHLGTGAYALDQVWHELWLLIAALLIATV